MGKTNEILRLLQYLQKEGIKITKDFENDISKLVRTNIEEFIAQFFRDFSRKNFENYNRFKKLNLTPKQKSRISGTILWRYEYRNSSNFRCIFIIQKDYNTDTPVLLCAFNEDGDKKNRLELLCP